MDAKRDWGHARDYVEMQWLMLQQEKPNDFVIATGQQISVRDFIKNVCKELEMTVEWSGAGLDETVIWKNFNGKGDDKIIVKVDKEYFRPTEDETLLGDITKAKQELNWQPKYSISQLISEMVKEDNQLAHDELVIKNSKQI